jgi:hypothetical protein
VKVTYLFDLDKEDSNDKFNLALTQHAFDMYTALDKLDNLRRNLYKGYEYYNVKNQGSEDESSEVDVDKLLDALSDIICSSGYFEASED